MTDRPQSTPGRQVRKRAYDGKWARWDCRAVETDPETGVVKIVHPLNPWVGPGAIVSEIADFAVVKLLDWTNLDVRHVCTGVFTSRYKALFG